MAEAVVVAGEVAAGEVAIRRTERPSRSDRSEATPAFRLSEPRAEVLKGIEHPVEVVSVDWH